jgi:hypothetical protein
MFSSHCRALHSSVAPKRVYNSILETIGNTPVVRVSSFM